LKRALVRSGDARAALAGFDAPLAPPSPLATVLARLPPDDGEALVRDWLEGAGVVLVGARPAGEIAARLRQKAEDAGAPRLAPAEKSFLLEALSCVASPKDLIATMQALVKRPVVRQRAIFEHALSRFAARWAAFQPIAADATVVASLQFGRGLAYYDGFVFEMEAPQLGARASLGGGGRYDGLLAAMAKALGGGPRDVSSWGAAGFALRPARLEAAAT
jgi:ATP phosphoribosyltransferase regulatory subunit